MKLSAVIITSVNSRLQGFLGIFDYSIKIIRQGWSNTPMKVAMSMLF